MLPVATTWPVLRFQTTLSARSRASRRNIRTSPLAVTISASIAYSSVPVENWIWFGSSGGACSGGGGGGASCRSRSCARAPPPISAVALKTQVANKACRVTVNSSPNGPGAFKRGSPIALPHADRNRRCALCHATVARLGRAHDRSEEHTSELQSLMRISYAVFCLNKKKNKATKPQRHKHYIKRTTRQTISHTQLQPN